jgi:hypothetical protein
MRRRIMVWLVVGALLMCAGGWALWHWSSLPPAWYSPPDAHDPGAVALAEKVENNLLEQSHRIRPPQEQWSIRIRQEQINAWLAARLKNWVEHEQGGTWPVHLGTPQVRLDEAGVQVAVPLTHGGTRRTLVIGFFTQMRLDRMEFSLTRVALGRIELPGERIPRLLTLWNKIAPGNDNSQWRDVSEWLTQRRNIDPVFALSDGRRVRVKGLLFSHGNVVVTLQTLHAEDR